MKAREDVLLRQVAGETLLIPTGEAALRLNGMATINEAGLVLWNALQKECTPEELAEALMAEYAVDRATALADAAEFVEKMAATGLLEVPVHA